MKLESYVKPFPRLLSRIPPFRSIKGSLVWDTIYMQPDVYADLVSDSPSAESRGYLVHEETYRARALEMGVPTFGLLYIMSKSFRLGEELAADRPRMELLVSEGEEFNLEKRARALSGPIYLWCVSYPEASSRLSEMLSEVLENT